MPIEDTLQVAHRRAVREQSRRGAFAVGFAALCLVGFAPPAAFCQTYTTTFEGTENPLSEGGKWSNAGLDWTHIRKGNGIAYSTQRGDEKGKYMYKDSLTVLSGFPADQEAWGEVHIGTPNPDCLQEVEILLHFTCAPHSATGYECFARCIDNDSSYLNIVRWDGPVGKFTYLVQKKGKGYGLKNGDILKATIVGNVISIYVNGEKKAEAVDDTFKTGNPGIGQYLECENGKGFGTNANFGFTNYTAKAIEKTAAGAATGSARATQARTGQRPRPSTAVGTAATAASK